MEKIKLDTIGELIKSSPLAHERTAVFNESGTKLYVGVLEDAPKEIWQKVVKEYASKACYMVHRPADYWGDEFVLVVKGKSRARTKKVDINLSYTEMIAKIEDAGSWDEVEHYVKHLAKEFDIPMIDDDGFSREYEDVLSDIKSEMNG